MILSSPRRLPISMNKRAPCMLWVWPTAQRSRQGSRQASRSITGEISSIPTNGNRSIIRSGNIVLGGYPGNFTADKTETYEFSGWNANLGFLWKMTEHWTLGGVFKTPFTADIDHEVSEDNTVTYPTYPAANTHTVTNAKYSDELRDAHVLRPGPGVSILGQIN